MEDNELPQVEPVTQDQCHPVSLMDQEMMFQVIGEAVLRLWDVVNGLTSIRPPRHKRYRVTIFGSARIQPSSPLYQDVEKLASELAQMGCDVVTGGGPGLMEAANAGHMLADLAGQSDSIGLRVDLGFEQETNPFVEQVYRHQTFFTRLHQFVLLSDAFVVVPGGIGTTLEALMIWQLLQVRHLQNAPLIMVGQMWADLVDWAKSHMVAVEPQLASPEDVLIPQCVDSCQAAIALLRVAHAQWQACRVT